MPYKLQHRGSGYKVTTPNHPQGFSKKPLPKKKAIAQLRAIKMNSDESLAERIVARLLETGEADQDYDHGPWDAIVRELEYNGIPGATHREFDKYQSIYLNIPGVGRFWMTEDSLSDVFALVPDEDDAHNGYQPRILVPFWETDNGEWTADVDSLVAYCEKVMAPQNIMKSAVDFMNKSETSKRRKRR